MKFRLQIILLTISITLFSLFLSQIITIFGYNSSFDSNIKLVEESLLNSNEEYLKELLTYTGKVLSIIYREAYFKAVGKSEEEKNEIIREAKETAKKLLSETRHSRGSGFFECYWVNGDKVITVLHGEETELEGKELDLEKMHFRKLIEMGKNEIGASFDKSKPVRYFENNPVTNQEDIKLSLSAYFSPWDWVIVTGFYMHDINAKGEYLKKQVTKDKLLITTRVVLMTLVFIVLVIISTYWFSYKISQPLNDVSTHALTLSKGVISKFQDDKLRGRKDEIGKLIFSFDKLNKTFVKNVKDMRSVSNKLGVLTTRNNKVVRELSEITDTEISSVEFISNGLEKSTRSIELIADSAKITLENLTEGEKKADEGYNLLKNITDRIEELSDSSKRIDNSLNVIHEISDRTNLLALNSSIEAVKAGERGVGFSVVADEIRLLSDKVRATVLNISDLISNNTMLTSQTKEVILNSKETFKAIMEHTIESKNMIVTINDNIKEQYNSSKKMMTSSNRVFSSYQKIVEIIKESRENSKTIEDVVDTLMEDVNYFKFKR